MRTSDQFPPLHVPAPGRSDATDSSPQLVYVPTSFDMDEFPSEQMAPAAAAPAESVGNPIADVIADASVAEVRPGATVVREFHPRAGEPADTLAPLAPRREDGRVTLVDVLDTAAGVNWREAVGIVYGLCMSLKDSTKQPAILLDPRNVEITSGGDVRVTPGQISGDPLVIQLGRLLRRMLSDASAPPELRLLVAQATFELPIFESVDDFARALRQLDRIEDSVAIRTAFIRATQQTVPQPETAHPEKPVAATRSILPPRKVRGRKRGSRAATAGEPVYMDRALIAAFLLGVVVIGWALIGPAGRRELPSPTGLPVESAAVSTGPGVPATTAVDERRDAPSAGAASAGREALPRPSRGDGRRVVTERAIPVAGRRVPAPDALAGPTLPARTAHVTTAAAPEDFAKRAAGLMKEGKAVDAGTVFDALVLTYPLYDPDRDGLTTESLTAFRNSRRLLLPKIAARDYERAKAALGSGDVDAALDLGRQVSAMLERLETVAEPGLDEGVRQLLTEATVIRSSAEQAVYNRGDADVVPPRPLSRQFPAATPYGVPPHRIGVLDMVIGTRGEVEIIKLHTPLNRYHERMIVSAAKAWRYHPAIKDGKPVRFRLSISINLPESGSLP